MCFWGGLGRLGYLGWEENAWVYVCLCYMSCGCMDYLLLVAAGFDFHWLIIVF
jgi:hypothetical protein